MIGNIVAVRTARAGLEKRRRVGVTDAELIEITDQLPRLSERKIPIELQSVGAAGDARMLFVHKVRNVQRLTARTQRPMAKRTGEVCRGKLAVNGLSKSNVWELAVASTFSRAL